MTVKVYYIENDNYAKVKKELMIIPCFVSREFVEMDYSEVTVKCRVEDLRTVENIIKSFV